MNLLTLSDDDFKESVNRELRKDQVNRDPRTHEIIPISDAEREELEALSNALRQPDTIGRWIVVLETMKHSSETQLGARLADVKKMHGTVPETEYVAALRDYQKWRAGNVRFLHRLQARLLEAKELRGRQMAENFPMRLIQERVDAEVAMARLLQEIQQHHDRQLRDYDPTEADVALWKALGEKFVAA